MPPLTFDVLYIGSNVYNTVSIYQYFFLYNWKKQKSIISFFHRFKNIWLAWGPKTRKGSAEFKDIFGGLRVEVGCSNCQTVVRLYALGRQKQGNTAQNLSKWNPTLQHNTNFHITPIFPYTPIGHHQSNPYSQQLACS